MQFDNCKREKRANLRGNFFCLTQTGNHRSTAQVFLGRILIGRNFGEKIAKGFARRGCFGFKILFVTDGVGVDVVEGNGASLSLVQF